MNAPAPDVNALWQCLQANGVSAALDMAQALLATHGRHPALLQPIGQLLLMAGRDADALPWLEAACAARPGDIDACNQRGLALSHLQRYTDAHAAFLHALRLAPAVAALYVNIGSNLNHARRFSEAETWLRQGLALAPDDRPLKANLAAALLQQNRLTDAQALLDELQQLGYQPSQVREARATLLQRLGRYADAETLVRAMLADAPATPSLLRLLAGIVGHLGRQEEQIALNRQVLALAPDELEVQSGLQFLLNYAESSDGPMLLAAARDYGTAVRRLHQRHRLQPYGTWHCEPQPARLRVGLVSGDFRNHPVGYFLDDVIPAMARSSIEFFAYANLASEDDLTQRIRPHFTAWRDITGEDDARVASTIREDGIHILVDLSGHTDMHRLPVFALKPAPVQASWLGYLGTTGIPEIDWTIADRHIAPDAAPAHFVEEIWRMRDSYVHLSTPVPFVALAGMPAAANGFVTFGSFNNPAKMTDAVVALWARVLHAVPDSRLFLKNPQLADPAVADRTIARYAAHGVAADRLILEGPSSRADLLAAYNRVDIALDPFPYTGGTTSLEALWMSVPVLSLRGERFLSRMGETLLINAGLPDWIAADADDYVRRAAAFAADRSTLARLRAGELRERVLASALMDTTRFSRDAEEAFWGMWRHPRNPVHALARR